MGIGLFGSGRAHKAYRGKHANAEPTWNRHAEGGSATGWGLGRFAKGGTRGGRTWLRLSAQLEHEEAAPPDVALLYDAENMGTKAFRATLSWAREIGAVRVVRAYGNAELLAGARWRSLARDTGVERVLCEGCHAGKNSADIRLVIDAVDLAGSDAVDCFVLASCDSDFAPLIRRLQAAGKRVHGVGRKGVNALHQSLYDSFQTIGGNRSGTASAPHDGNPRASGAPFGGRQGRLLASRAADCGIGIEALELALRCAERGAGTDAWCRMSQLGMLMRKENPQFSYQSYGCKNLTAFIVKTELFELQRNKGVDYIRPRGF